MVQRGGVALTLLAALVGLLALHPLSSAYARAEAHPAIATVSADAPSVAPTVGVPGGGAHTAGCPESPADGHAAPIAQLRSDEHRPAQIAVVVPTLQRSQPSGPSPATAPALTGSVLSGARLLIGLGISRT